MNVWSHVIGALFCMAMVLYVLFYMHPTSLHEGTALMTRWSSDFDTGRFDQLYCDKPDFKFPKPDQCPYKPEELLDDLLETEQFLSWHKNVGSKERISMGHYNLNYHAVAFEQVDHYLRNAMVVLSHPPAFFQQCLTCARNAIAKMPDYLNEKLD